MIEWTDFYFGRNTIFKQRSRMFLIELEKGQNAVVKKIHASSELKRRLISFGIIKGARIKLLATAPKKSTIEIEVGKMKLALRKEEAKTIEVTIDA